MFEIARPNIMGQSPTQSKPYCTRQMFVLETPESRFRKNKYRIVFKTSLGTTDYCKSCPDSRLKCPESSSRENSRGEGFWGVPFFGEDVTLIFVMLFYRWFHPSGAGQKLWKLFVAKSGVVEEEHWAWILSSNSDLKRNVKRNARRGSLNCTRSNQKRSFGFGLGSEKRLQS